jgi:CRP-like cAMP-binding protein
MNHLSAILAAHPLFTDLAPSEIEDLTRNSTLRRYQPGEQISWHGDVWPYIFLIIEGEVKAIKESGKGRSLLVATFGPGDMFWGLAFFHDGTPMPVRLEASEACQIFLWSRERMLPFLLKNAKMTWELCRVMVRQMLRASAILEEQTFYPVDARLARMLLNSFETKGDAALARSMTLDEMAAHIGSTREMVCRTLYRFADNNLIEVTRTEFSLVDKEGLAELIDNE